MGRGLSTLIPQEHLKRSVCLRPERRPKQCSTGHVPTEVPEWWLLRRLSSICCQPKEAKVTFARQDEDTREPVILSLC